MRKWFFLLSQLANNNQLCCVCVCVLFFIQIRSKRKKTKIFFSEGLASLSRRRSFLKRSITWARCERILRTYTSETDRSLILVFDEKNNEHFQCHDDVSTSNTRLVFKPYISLSFHCQSMQNKSQNSMSIIRIRIIHRLTRSDIETERNIYLRSEN